MGIEHTIFTLEDAAFIRRAADHKDMDYEDFIRWALIVKAHEVMNEQPKPTIENPFGDK